MDALRRATLGRGDAPDFPIDRRLGRRRPARPVQPSTASAAAADPPVSRGSSRRRSSSPPTRWRRRPGLEVLKRRRQRGRCGDRRAGDAVAGRAAELRHRRRRLHDLLRRAHRQGLDPRRPRGRAGAGDVRPCSCAPTARRMPFARSGAERPRHRRPGRRPDACRCASERGKLPWNSLFGDAERTARDGFIVSPRLARLVRGDFPQNKAPDVVAYFTQAGRRAGRRPATGCAIRPTPTSCGGSPTRARGALCRIDRGADRRAHPRRTARRVDDPGRPRRLPAGEARGAVPARTGSTSCAFRRRRRAASG